MNSITVTASKSQGNIIFSFYAPMKTQRILKDGLRGGEHTLATRLEDLTYVKEIQPACYRTFDPKSQSYNKIDCIRNVRAATGWDLMTAKSFVEMAFHIDANINTCTHL